MCDCHEPREAEGAEQKQLVRRGEQGIRRCFECLEALSVITSKQNCYPAVWIIDSCCLQGWGRGDTISLLHIDRLRNGWRLSSRLPPFVPNGIHNPSHTTDWVSLIQRNCEPWEGSRTPTRVIPTSPRFFLKLTELLPPSRTWPSTLPRMLSPDFSMSTYFWPLGSRIKCYFLRQALPVYLI